MTLGPRLLVFSDLDGTLLDHRTYAWQPAAQTLERLKLAGCGVILASSKTAAEIVPLRDAMGLGDWPAIVENGGGILEPGADGTEGAQTYRELRAAIARLPQGFTGFGDMTPQDIADHTDLSPEAAAHAQARQFSEPGLWTGADADRDAFVAAAQDAGLTLQQGGRFLTLSFGGTKADRMAEVVDRYRPARTVALGDAPNDVAMLERADICVVVANSASPGVPPLAGEDDAVSTSRRILRTTAEGPTGWAEAVNAIMDEITTTKDPRPDG
ncbi:MULTISPECIES: HAD-IIB family hydrolase [unclassified Roseovarius]|uniref:HAD-IIB family hydrolase n=1 Tax=unclassified Roseovarius TaxID=2614913 RepID=UPI00273D847A|nr:HAD-IIB family hydrolase [Roseovarius sp. MMSF_3350]